MNVPIIVLVGIQRIKRNQILFKYRRSSLTFYSFFVKCHMKEMLEVNRLLFNRCKKKFMFLKKHEILPREEWVARGVSLPRRVGNSSGGESIQPRYNGRCLETRNRNAHAPPPVTGLSSLETM